MNGNNGFIINGIINFDDRAVSSVSFAGDINNDGLSDMIIGAHLANPTGKSDAGQVYVLFGRSSFASTLELSSLNRSNDFTINGIGSGDFAGGAVSICQRYQWRWFKGQRSNHHLYRG